ncbi:MAG TPA: hypothetical protein VGN77_01680, partial [Steroidobacteraceae bacterium]|nr:hypothetical protein [Steroidobacteraceae bacterium]
MPALLFILALVLAALDVSAPDLLRKWTASNQEHDTLLSWMPVLGGLAISCIGGRSGSDVTQNAAKSSYELARRRLAIAEGAVLVAPLLVLWPFALVVFAVENHMQIATLLIGLALLGIAVAALVAL